MMDDKTKALDQKVTRIILLVLVALLSWFAYERLTVIQNSESLPATVLDCKDEWTTYRPSSSSTTTRRTVISAPLAITEDGQMAYGSVKVPEDVCKRMVGTAISVYVHKDDPSKNRINSFLQFWIFPSLLCYCIFAMFFNTRTPIRGAFLTVLVFCLSGYLIAAELNYVNLGQKPAPIKANMSPSEQAFNNCILREMHKKDLSSRAEIIVLICQEHAITDLSSIADLVNLEELYLQGNALADLTSFTPHPKLKKISIAGNKTLTSIAGIENAPLLEELQANKSAISDINGVSQLSHLKVIGMMMNKISDISELSALNKLEDVTLNYNSITDISALNQKPHLKKLQLYANQISDISPLYTNTALEIAGIGGEDNVTCPQFDHLRSLLKSDAKVFGPKHCDDQP
jgi:Leucine-rich repeat (LRR) protein